MAQIYYSDKDVQADYDKRKAAGYLDRLYATELKRIPELDTRALNALKAVDAFTLGDLTTMPVARFATGRNVGLRTIENVCDVLVAHKAFFYCYKGNDTDKSLGSLPEDRLKAALKLPTFDYLWQNKHIDAYLADGDKGVKQAAVEKEAAYTKELSAELEADHREEFVDRYIGEQLRAANQVDAFLQPLQDFDAGRATRAKYIRSLAGYTGATGEQLLIVGDLALKSTQELKDDFHLNKSQLEIVTEALHDSGLTTDMRNQGREAYNAFINSMVDQSVDQMENGEHIAKRQKDSRHKYGL